VLFAEDLSRVFVVELKTEPGSAGGENNSYLNDVINLPSRNPWRFKSCCRRHQTEIKYDYLISN